MCQRIVHALIWLAVVLAIVLLYFYFKMEVQKHYWWMLQPW